MTAARRLPATLVIIIRLMPSSRPVTQSAVTQGFDIRQKRLRVRPFFFIVVSPLERIARQVIGIEPYRRGLRDAPC